jgi:hypothetical protein
MPSFTYISIKKFAHQVVIAFRENILREASNSTVEFSEPTHSKNDAEKVRVSLNDLKIISSALLHFKKLLLKKNDAPRAQAVSEVDQRIYELIMSIEQSREVQHEREGVVA